MSIPRLSSYPLPGADALPAARLSWDFDPDRAALLVHDMQRYFLDFYEDGFAPLVDNIGALVDLDLPRAYTAQPPCQPAEERGLLVDRWGPGLQDRHEILPALAPRTGDLVLRKRRYSAFWGSDELRTWLAGRGRDQLVICGVYAGIGVTATALDAFSWNIAPFVPADAIADFTPRAHEAALEHLAATCAVVTTTAALTSGGRGAEAPSLAEVRAAILALLEEPADDDENLIDAGLDSIAVMGLIEQWKMDGYDVGFADLAAEPTIEGFHRAMAGRR